MKYTFRRVTTICKGIFIEGIASKAVCVPLCRGGEMSSRKGPLRGGRGHQGPTYSSGPQTRSEPNSKIGCKQGLKKSFPRSHCETQSLGGSVGWASDFGSGHDLAVCESKPSSGSVLTAQILEPASDSVFPFPSAPPLLVFSVFQKWINIKKKVSLQYSSRACGRWHRVGQKVTLNSGQQEGAVRVYGNASPSWHCEPTTLAFFSHCGGLERNLCCLSKIRLRAVAKPDWRGMDGEK